MTATTLLNFHEDYTDAATGLFYRRGAQARVLDNAALVARILEKPNRATDVTSLRDQVGGNVITFARHGIIGVGDESAKLQAACDEASETGKILLGDPITVGVESSVFYRSGLRFLGRGCRIEKRFTAGGNNAAFRHVQGEEDDTVGVHLEEIEFGSDTWFDGDQGILGDGNARNKPVVIWGKHFVTRNITIRRWSGFGFTTGGDYHYHQNLHFEDPFPGDNKLFPGNADGMHMVFGRGHVYDGITGAAGDDLVAILAPLLGDRSNEDIREVIVRGVFGRSLWGRLISIGTFNATMDCTHEDILVEGFYGTGGAPAAGVVEIDNKGGGTGRNITLRNGRVAPRILGAEPDYLDDGDNTGPATLAGIRILNQGSGGQHNIRIENVDVRGGTQNGILSANSVPIDGLNIDARVDATGCTGAAVVLAAPVTGRSHIRLDIKCGNSHGITLFAANPSKQLDFDLRIFNVPTGFRAVNNTRCSHSTFRIREVTKAGAATGTVGYFEASTADNNWIHDSSLTGVDTAVQRVSAGTRLDRVEGFTNPGESEPGDGDGSGGQLSGRGGIVQFAENQANFYVVLDPPEPNTSYSVACLPQGNLDSNGDPAQKVTPAGIDRNVNYFRIVRHVPHNNAQFLCSWQLIRNTDTLQTGGASPPD